MQIIGLGNINRCPLGKEFGGQVCLKKAEKYKQKKRIYPLGLYVLCISEGNFYRSHSYTNLVKRC